MRFNGEMKGKKGTTDEGGVRVPGLIRWPRGIRAGIVIPQIAGAIDLLPTLVSLAQIERIGDKPLDGVDLSPLLTGKISNASQDSPKTSDWPARMIFSTWAGRTSVRTDQYRLDDKGLLYDMIDDPGQTTDRSDDFPELAATLRQAVAKWEAEMKAEADKKRPSGVGSTDRQRLQVDPRPIHVGFKEFPITILPARDGEPRGNVKRSSSAPNSSYFVNWTSTDDSVVWSVTVQNAGRYDVTIDYTCPIADAGAEVELRFGSSVIESIITPGWDPPLYDNQDTLPRPPAESKMKPFRTLALGQIELPSGAGELQLRALKIPAASVMDLRRLTLTYIND
jgi:hypothetical protein